MNMEQLYNSFQKLSRIFFKLVMRRNGLGKSFLTPFWFTESFKVVRVGDRRRAAYNQVV